MKRSRRQSAVGQQSQRRSPPSRRIAFEFLEPRLALTTFTVTSLSDGPVNLADNVVTLRDGVAAPMLGRGAPLPEGCALAAIDAQSNHVTARYACPGRSTALALDLYVGRPTAPIPGYSGRFGVETSEGFSRPLRDAVLARVSAGENRLNWQIEITVKLRPFPTEAYQTVMPG